MTNSISNTQDLIDSRDVIARIEELTDQQTPRFIAGWNMPGYMPDSEPAEFDDADDAREYIIEELERAAEQAEEYIDNMPEGDETGAADRLAELEKAINGLSHSTDDEHGFTVAGYYYFITEDGVTGLDEDETDELEALEALNTEGEQATSEWKYGETLIAEDYFTAYSQQLAEDIEAVNRDARWPNNHIDWEAAADELKQDYTTIDFQGSTYYIRA